MTARSLHLRIRRLVLDSPASGGAGPDALGEAVRRQLGAQLGVAIEPIVVTPQSESLAPLAGSIATGISARLTNSVAGNRP